MADADKITILLADDDALRRDGLAAVLQATTQFRIIARCGDGEEALSQIRALLPDVAVVDLNIPKLHGIELIRRVRSENPGTKIVVLSGSSEDDLIREVVRAGGDGYLLKNGPARHLIDAISYVRDGGQYFSPQLRRDGLNRNLLEETPRPQTESRPARDRGYGRSRRTSDPQRFRERLREEGATENLRDRDYEILGMMADGIRPILDRLDEIEGRVNGMETGEEPVPGDVRGWLDVQMTDTFQGARSGPRDLEAKLPQMIEAAVTARFHQMADKLQQQVEDTHLRTLETFVKNIQVKLVQRVSALETNMSKQAEAVIQLREYTERTEDNLSRLITGVDRLAQELPKRLLAAESEPEPKPRRRRSSRSFSPKLFWIGAAAVAVVVGGGITISKSLGGKAPAPAAIPVAGAAAKSAEPPAASADTRTKMQAAQGYSESKDYATAEDIYKQVIKSEPNNTEAMKALASVLYREDKIEESAAILDKLPRN